MQSGFRRTSVVQFESLLKVFSYTSFQVTVFGSHWIGISIHEVLIPSVAVAVLLEAS